MPARSSSPAGAPRPPAGPPTPLRRRLLAAAGAVVALGIVWLGVTAVLAHRQLRSAEASVRTAQEALARGDLEAARSAGRGLGPSTRRAHRLTAGPAWWTAAHVPVLGVPARSVRELTASAAVLGRTTVPALLEVSTALDPASLRDGADRIDVAKVEAVGPRLQAALASSHRASRLARRAPATSWLPPVDRARVRFAERVAAVERSLSSAAEVQRVLPGLLGQGGTKRYVLGVQNEAELRGLGGLPGTFGLITVADGRFSISDIVPNTDLLGIDSGVGLGPAFDAQWGDARPTTFLGNANISPHFPYAAQIWAATWERKTGQRVDGAIAIDPTVIAYLLTATGPVTVSTGEVVSADNIVSLTEQDLYARFDDGDPSSTARKAALVHIGEALDDALLRSDAPPQKLLAAGQAAIAERRLLVWSADPTAQAVLAGTAVGGVVPETDRAYVGPFVVNERGNKLDAYLDRTITWQRRGCGRVADVTLTVQLHNDAPLGLPAAAVAVNDEPAHPVAPGDHRVLVHHLATAGATFTDATLDGVPVDLRVGAERGHPVLTADVELPRGATRTLVVHLREPRTPGTPLVLRQPGIRPLSLTVDDARC